MSEYEATPSYIHRQRGRCCKSACLHCPYGHTVSTLGFQIKSAEADSDTSQEVMELISECLKLNQSSGVAAMLLSQAFKIEPTISINSENSDSFQAIYLKGFFCGCIHTDGSKKKLYLMPKFQDQNILLEDILACKS